ncbi:MAG: ABC transporter ATP-binding protein [Holosporales bacterium]|nr:ABC transporter ATP-binding protein [Holosporales bacterium]
MLTISHIYKKFPYVDVLNDINLHIKKGEGVALIGESGSGKSTLLHIASLLESPTSGDVIIDGHSTSRMNDKEKTKIRRENIGFVYQFHNLLPEFNSLENVMMPLLINGVSKEEASEKSNILLKSVGLGHRIKQFPKKLSGGEQQRVAIARALAASPKIIMADEPTGNLDGKTSYEVFDLFLDMIHTKNVTLFMATHNLDIAKKLHRQVLLQNGSCS